jgi:hypothetical protein
MNSQSELQLLTRAAIEEWEVGDGGGKVKYDE